MIRFSSSMIYRLFWWFSSSQAANYGGFLKWIPKYQNARMPTIPCLTTDRHQLPRRCCIFPRRRELHHFEVNPNNMGRFQSYLRLPDNSQANFWSPCWRSENMIIIEQQFPMTWNESYPYYIHIVSWAISPYPQNPIVAIVAKVPAGYPQNPAGHHRRPAESLPAIRWETGGLSMGISP